MYKSSWGWTLGCSEHVEDTVIKLKNWNMNVNSVHFVASYYIGISQCTVKKWKIWWIRCTHSSRKKRTFYPGGGRSRFTQKHYLPTNVNSTFPVTAMRVITLLTWGRGWRFLRNTSTYLVNNVMSRHTKQ